MRFLLHGFRTKFFYMVVASTDEMACGSKGSATVPVVIDACPAMFECSHVQGAGCRSVGSVGEKRRKLAIEFLNVTISTPPNSKKVVLFRVFSCKKSPRHPVSDLLPRGAEIKIN
jgi:hypothetical protein